MSKPVQRVNAIAITARTGRSRKNPKKTTAGAMNIAPARVLRRVGNATVVTSTGDAARLLGRLLHLVDDVLRRSVAREERRHRVRERGVDGGHEDRARRRRRLEA